MLGNEPLGLKWHNVKNMNDVLAKWFSGRLECDKPMYDG